MQGLLGEERQRRRANIAARGARATAPATPTAAATAPTKAVPAALTIWSMLWPTPAAMPAVATFERLLWPAVSSVPSVATWPILAATLPLRAMIGHARLAWSFAVLAMPKIGVAQRMGVPMAAEPALV